MTTTTKPQYTFVPASRFLSGDVRSKRDRLLSQAADDPLLKRSLEAIERVQPIDIPIDAIDLHPGAYWFPRYEISEFLRHVFGFTCKITCAKLTATWDITHWHSGNTFANTDTYGMEWKTYRKRRDEDGYDDWQLIQRKLTGVDLFRMLLDGKSPTIRTMEYGQQHSVVNHPLTAVALNKMALLKEEFIKWCRSDPDRSARLVRIYNDTCNNIVLRSYDGSHLALSNMTQLWRDRVNSRSYQKDGIYRGLSGVSLDGDRANIGIFYEVGLGKTICLVAIACEQILNRLADRVLVVVQKATIGDFKDLFREAYPQVSVLVAGDEDLSIHKRQMFLARAIASGAQVIVLTHEAFSKIPLRQETKMQFFQMQLDAVKEAKADLGTNDEKNESVKSLVRAENRLLKKIEDLSEKHDAGICLEDISPDRLFIDEYDVFKNAWFYTKHRNVSGIPSGSSDRADEFKVKNWWLEKKYGCGRDVLATGTFISNSLTELWNLLMDLAPNQMRLRGWHIFDAWAVSCATIKTAAAIKNTGQIERETRLSEFCNLPEQLQLLYACADVKDAGSPGVRIDRPTPKYVNVVVPMSLAQRQYMNDLVDRANLVKKREPNIYPKLDKDGNQIVKDGDLQWIIDNNLFITTDGRKSMTDYRLVEPDAIDFNGSKINVCCRRVYKIWERTRLSRKTQIIFLDMGVNPVYVEGRSFHLYGAIKEKLLELADRDGLREEFEREFAIAQEHKSDSDRRALHKSMREGSVRVALASTEIMGVGANVHRKLLALHHLDFKWRPRDMVQREGRIIRSGNENSRVLIYRYVTQGVDGNVGFDSFILDKIRYKLQAFQPIYSGVLDPNLRRIQDTPEEDPSFNCAQLVALATGDDRIMRYVELEAELQLKESLLAGYRSEVKQLTTIGLQSRGKGLPRCIPIVKGEIDYHAKMLDSAAIDAAVVAQERDDCTGDNFKVQINRIWYTDYKSAAAELYKIGDRLYAQMQQMNDRVKTIEVGIYGGFTLLLTIDRALRLLTLKGSDSHQFRLLADPVDAMRRLESEYRAIERAGDRHAEKIRELNAHLTQLEEELRRREDQVIELSTVVERLKLDKSTLEAELGLAEADREMEIVDVDGED